ncbi:MAG: GHKL domain-containing protein [Lachnospiraceae bacterium]|nr:GHKL domain-containing protein [Lachnospiraceae bacterium]
MKHYNQLQKELAEQEEKYLRILSQKSELEYELSAKREETAYFEKQESDVRALHQSVRQLKHDMKNHLMVIASYLNSEDYEAAKTYTSQILDKLNTMHSYIETGNSLLNHILNEKLEFAGSCGIAIKAEIENISFAGMRSIDFSALLTNLLDNAIEASKNEPDGELIIHIFKERGYDAISVKNKIGKSVLEENPELISTKEDKKQHGIGISQIKEIVTSYDGICDFYEKEGYFCSRVFIPQ